MGGVDEESPFGADSTSHKLLGPISTILLGLGYCAPAIQATLGALIAPKLAQEPLLGNRAQGICQSAFWFGAGLSCFLVLPQITGRRQPILCMMTLGIAAALLSCLADGWILYGFSLFVVGCCVFPGSALCMLLLQESMHPSYWPTVIATLNGTWSALVVGMAVVGSVMQTPSFSWRTESGLWYVLLMAPVVVLGPCFVRESAMIQADADNEVLNVRDGALGSLMVVFITSSLGYYGLQYAAGELSPDRFVDMGILGVVDLASYFLSTFVINRFGTVKTQTSSMMVTALAFMLASFLPSKSFRMMFATMLGRCGFNFNYNTMYVLILEIYPAKTRTAALGYCAFVMRLSAMCGPFMAFLNARITCCLLAGLSLASAAVTPGLASAIRVSST
eukprot:TRINITY_DN44167_c0_g1_i1.p1 TRINITY_DN44167_c0_g1~~TRINITY_DN44167_c0_g1_i1.p1  ORF type:complete len:391 (+),score=39.58 TRINITY_DN44167_c0_g1_i1:101-1273(+)